VNKLANLRARRDDEQGFTLIELMVVVLIIAILIAIAIPTFLGAKSRSQDKSAQSSLRNALTNAKGIYTDSETYAAATAGATGTLQQAEPSLSFSAAATASTDPKVVSVQGSVTGANPAGSVVVMAAESKSGKCFAIADNVNGPGTMFMYVGKNVTCSANGAISAADPTSIASATGLSAPGTEGSWATSW
jgi:type IV pilus assembly protein PilA